MKNIWDGKPNHFVINNLDFFKSGTVLVLGGNIGRNAIPIAQKGFKVTNVDLEKEAIDLFKQKAREIKIEVEGVVANIQAYKFETDFDNILTAFTLHFSARQESLNLINKIKNNTKQYGINMILGFTNLGDFNVENSDRLYFNDNELLKLYENWDVLNYKKFMSDTKAGVKQQVVAIVAKKL